MTEYSHDALLFLFDHKSMSVDVRCLLGFGVCIVVYFVLAKYTKVEPPDDELLFLAL